MSDQALRDNMLSAVSLAVMILFAAVVLNAWFVGWL